MSPRPLRLASHASLRRLVRDSVARAIEHAPEGELVEALAFELTRAFRRAAGELAGLNGDDVQRELQAAHEDLDASRTRTTAELSEAEEELELHRLMLDDAHGAMVARADAEAPDGELKDGLNGLFDQAEQGGLPLDELRARTLELVGRSASASREAMLAAWAAERDRQVDQLRRRLDKVNRSLAASEAALGRLAESQEVDPGIASIYRTVQGLDMLAPDAARKRLLMKEIYRANLALRERRDSA